MVTITVGNSYSQIKGLSPEAFKKLRKELSYVDNPNARFFTGGFSRTKYCIDIKGFYPTGLNKRVKAFLRAHNILYYTVAPDRPPIVKVNHGFSTAFPPYEAQRLAVEAAITKGRGTIAMPTGTGKSLVIALIAAKLGVKTLIVVPNLEIKAQLIKSFNELFKTLKHITIENIDSKALKSAKDYDCLIIDEAHHVGAKTYHKLNKSVWQGIRYRFFLTATPFRNDPEEQLLFEGIAGDIIFKLSYKDAIDNKYIVPVEAYYFELPKREVSGRTWAQVYKECIVNNKERNELIAELLITFAHSGSTLCLVKEIAHGEALSALTGVPFANGLEIESRSSIGAFSKGEIPALIGTQGIIGEGVDTKACEFVLIAGLGKAKSAFMQQVGRAVRRFGEKESAKVILFKDKSHKFTLTHFNAQCKVLKEEYGVTAVKLDGGANE